MTIGGHESFSPQEAATTLVTRSHKRPLPTALLAFVAVTAVLLLLFFGHQLAYADRVFPGVYVDEVDVGSLTQADLQSVLEKRYRDVGSAPVAVSYGGRESTHRLGELGVKLDTQATIRRALRVGREGNLLQQLIDRLAAIKNRAVVAPVFVPEEAALNDFIRRIARTVDKPAVEARLVAQPAGVEITPSASGLKVNVEKTAQSVREALAQGLPGRVALVVEQVQPAIVEADLREARAVAEKIVAAPVEIAYDQRTWTIDRAELAAMVVVRPATNPDSAHLTASLDEAALGRRLAAIAAEIDRAPRDARIVLERGRFVVVPSQDGLTVDVGASVTEVLKAAIDVNRRAALKVDVKRPPVLTEHLASAATAANQMVSTPIVIKFENRSWTLPREQLISMIKFEEAPEAGRLRPYFDEATLTKYLSNLATQVNRPARNARVQFSNGALKLLAESQDGVTVKVAETAAAISSQAKTDDRAVELRVTIEKPKLSSDQVNSIVVKDLLAKASTSYAGSIPERAHNVKLATSRLNGVLLAPGEEFSFNDALGPVTLQSGYQIGYGITLANGQMVTVPSEGGGICQVATTVFHAAFWAGLDITQRYPHMYWIPRYGQPPLGMKGLDATVDHEYGVDLKFRNNTGNWLALVGEFDSANIYFSFYGVKPQWEVKVEGPFISNVVKADTKLVRQEDPTLPQGREILVEHAEDGFDARVVRTVLKDGQPIDRLVVVSHYNPSRNVLLVGTKRPEPKPTPTPSPMPTPSPSPSPSATPTPTVQPTPTATPTPPPGSP